MVSFGSTRQRENTATGLIRHRALCLSLLLPLLASAAYAGSGEPPSLPEILYDAAVDRPIGLAETAVGIGIASIAYPLALASDRADLVVERCIAAPARHTFKRSLGDLSRRGESLCSPVGLGWGLVRVALGAVERPIALLFGRSPLSQDPRDEAEELEI